MPNKERKPILPMTQERIDMFWSQVDIGEDQQCWPWKTGKDQRGYGFFLARSTHGWSAAGVGEKRHYCNIRAHRIAFALAYGHDPVNLVCHRCDNTSCCNPAHLFDGTNQDNSNDCKAKGRAKPGPNPSNPGMRNTHKLTDDQVIEIRKQQAQGQKAASLAKKYGVTISTIYHVVMRYTWRHIE